MSIIKMVMSHWERIATRLYFESYIVDAIQRDNNHSVENACRTVFTYWLGGMDQLREPISWSTVIKALKEAELSEVATKVEDILMPEHADS